MSAGYHQSRLSVAITEQNRDSVAEGIKRVCGKDPKQAPVCTTENADSHSVAAGMPTDVRTHPTCHLWEFLKHAQTSSTSVPISNI